MSRESAILITLVIYKIVLVAFGFIAQQRTKDGTDFFLGGRGLGPWVAAISASASSSSAWTLLGVSGAAYAWGISAVWLFPACIGGFLFNWYVLAPALRRHSIATRAVTVTEAIAPDGSEGTPSQIRAVRALAAIIVLISLTTYVAAQFQGAGKTFHETFGLSTESSVLIGSAIVIFYTMLGGFWAVSLTDTLQGIMMALTSVILPVAALIAVGGPSGLVESWSAVETPGYSSLIGDRTLIIGLGFAIGLVGIGLGYPGQPHVVNRFMALRDEAAVVTARRIAITWGVIVYAGMLILGWCGRVLLTALPDNEVVFIALTNELFQPVVAGIMIAAVLSAIMSTADSQLLVAASAVTHDLGWGGDHMVSRSRIVVVLLSGAAVIAAIWGPSAIFDRVLFAWTAMGSAFGPLLIVTALRGPVPAQRALWSMALGFGLAVLAFSFPETKGGVIERVLPFAVAFAVAWFEFPRASAPQPAES